MSPAKAKAATQARPRSSHKAGASVATAPLPALGSLLREAREARELTLDTVADELMIRKYYLESLEDGLYRQLPERVYAVGFVQNYAQLLGLDAEALVEQFKREAYGGRGAAGARMELAMPTPVSQSLMPNRSALFIVGGLLILLLVSGIVWNARQPSDDAARIQSPPANAADVSIRSVTTDTPSGNNFGNNSADKAPVPDRTAIVSGSGTVTQDAETATGFDAPQPAAPDFAPPVPAPAAASAQNVASPAADMAAANPSQVTTPATTAAPAAAAPVNMPKGTRILIEAIQPSWVEVADADGNILFTNILRLGQALPIPDRPGITLTAGNAAGVQIVLDGRKLGPLGRAGEVKRAVPLDPAKIGTR